MLAFGLRSKEDSLAWGHDSCRLAKVTQVDRPNAKESRFLCPRQQSFVNVFNSGRRASFAPLSHDSRQHARISDPNPQIVQADREWLETARISALQRGRIYGSQRCEGSLGVQNLQQYPRKARVLWRSNHKTFQRWYLTALQRINRLKCTVS